MPTTYEPIATATLGANAAQLEITGLPSTYTDLDIVITNVKASADGSQMVMRINGDTTTNYSFTKLHSTGSAIGSLQGTAFSNWNFNATNSDTTYPSTVILTILGYADTGKWKHGLAHASHDNNGSGDIARFVGQWRSMSAITAIRLLFNAGANLTAGSTITVYGVKAA